MRQYRASTRLRWARAGDDLVVVDSRTGATHLLDPQGARLMELLEDWTSPVELAAGYLTGPEAPAGADGLATAVEATLEEFRMIRLVDRR
jgi:PqqD family protein of HPr-rel-A system